MGPIFNLHVEVNINVGPDDKSYNTPIYDRFKGGVDDPAGPAMAGPLFWPLMIA